MFFQPTKDDKIVSDPLSKSDLMWLKSPASLIEEDELTCARLQDS